MKIKFAVAGAGHIGKRHADMIRRNPETELVAMADIRKREELGLGDIGVPLFGSVAGMLQSDLPFDVLCVATPNGLHYEHAMAGLESGRHVVIEKPMALTAGQCRDIVDKAESLNKLVFCVMQNRYSPPAAWAREMIDSGRLGHIHMVQINCFWNRDERYYKPGTWKGSMDLDGGTLFTQFAHFIDMLYWLFGDISDIHAVFGDFSHQTLTEFEDSGLVQFRLNGGGLGSLAYSTALWDKNCESSLTIIAANGTVKIGGQYMNEVEYCHIRDYEMPQLPPANPANDYGPYKGSAANHNFVIENVVETLRRGGSPTTNAMEGLKVVEIIGRMYRGNPYFAQKAKNRTL